MFANLTHHYKVLICLLLLWPLQGQAQTYLQSTQEMFGKNRVQYRRFYWKDYRTNNFEVYFYDGGTRSAKMATRFVENSFGRMSDLLGYTPFAKTKIFLYNSIHELQQSNIGLDRSYMTTGGQTNLFSPYAEIPYTGSDIDYKNELLFGVAKVYVYEMMHGGGLRDILSTTFLTEFSEWFQFGAIKYVAHGWSEEMDNYLRDMFTRRIRAGGKTKNVRRPTFMFGKDAVVAGQSVWNYIVQKYGDAAISNVLNLARIIRNEKNSIASTLGINHKAFFKQWEMYYRELVRETLDNTDEPEFDAKLKMQNRKNYLINDIKISPDGSQVAYTLNNNGRFKVIRQDLQTKKMRKKTMMRAGYKAIYQRYHENTPLIDWQNNDNLGIVNYKKGAAFLTILDGKKKKTFEREWLSLAQIHSFDISEDGNFVVFSGTRKGMNDAKTGQNDLFIYDFDLNYVRDITSDFEDDLHPSFVGGRNDLVVFSSNRQSDTLTENTVGDIGDYENNYTNLDLFLYDFSDDGSPVLKRLTYGPGNDIKAVPFDENTFVYTSDDYGIYQLFKYNLETDESKPLTNWSKSIHDFDASAQSQSLVYTRLHKGKHRPYLKTNFNFDNTANIHITPRIRLLEEQNRREVVEKPKEEILNPVVSELSPDEVDTDDYMFSDEALEPTDDDNASPFSILGVVRRVNDQEIQVRGAYDYEPKMRARGFTTSFMLDPLRGFGFVLNASISDILENHKIRAGLIGSSDFRSSLIFAEYQYIGRRLDFSIKYLKDALFINRGTLINRYRVNRFEIGISFPFTNTLRFSFTPFYLNTLYTNLSPLFLTQPDNRTHYAGARSELVFDNTIITGMNVMRGTRAKLTLENYIGISNEKNSFGMINFDARNYLPIHKEITFATRIAAGQFFGPSPKRFMLGGVDNWMGGQMGSSGQGDPLQFSDGVENSSIMFSRFVTNMRGFDFNKFSGSSYFVANFELRIPIVRYLFGRRFNSNFLKNLQLTSFTDIGSAWSSGNPFVRVSNVTSEVIQPPNSPFSATIENFRSPFLVGYGFGARTMLLNYYLKLDVAWSIEDAFISRSPRFYISFGYDF